MNGLKRLGLTRTTLWGENMQSRHVLLKILSLQSLRANQNHQTIGKLPSSTRNCQDELAGVLHLVEPPAPPRGTTLNPKPPPRSDKTGTGTPDCTRHAINCKNARKISSTSMADEASCSGTSPSFETSGTFFMMIRNEAAWVENFFRVCVEKFCRV